jgi:hypothetical protein
MEVSDEKLMDHECLFETDVHLTESELGVSCLDHGLLTEAIISTHNYCASLEN